MLKKRTGMFSNPLIEVPIIELLKLWGELIEAYHGVNGFGGNVAEIYAYRFQCYSPLAHTSPLSKSAKKELHIINVKAGNALVALLEEFCEQYDCKALIDGTDPQEWCKYLNFNKFEFDHRVRVTIRA